MEINSDYKNLLRSLNAAGVRYLVVGGVRGNGAHGAEVHEGS